MVWLEPDVAWPRTQRHANSGFVPSLTYGVRNNS